ncbi:hypothetical protein HYT57_03655 [Candidatus Woesearchaeota archaeon]|nr:hypothetical protein [Candidatus Woesearchaeota archaeon]
MWTIDPVLNMKENLFTKLYVNRIAIIILAILVLGTPLFLRGIDNINGVEPYFNQRLADLVHGTKIPGIDPLSFGSREFVYPIGTPLLLSNLEKVIPSNLVLTVLPFILGILFVIICFSILKSYDIEEKVILISSIVLVFSPPFIYTFSVFNSFTIPVFLNIFAVYLLLKDNRFLNAIAIILFLLIPFFGYIHAIFSLLFLMFYYLRRHKPFVKITSLCIVLILALVYWKQLGQFSFSYIMQEKDLLLMVVSEFGGNFGISLFSFFLMFFGLRHLWKDKYQYSHVYLSLLAIFLIFLVNQKTSIYLTLVMSPIIALGLIELYNSRWESFIIKNVTLILLISGLIFSGLSFVAKIPQLPPTQDMIESLQFIKDSSDPNDVVFSHYTNGIFINSIALRPNVLDENMMYAPQLKERIQDSKVLVKSRDFELTKSILQKYHVRYVYITPDMKNGLVWNEPEEGLLFVLKYSGDNFDRVYSQKRIDIWRVNF